MSSHLTLTPRVRQADLVVVVSCAFRGSPLEGALVQLSSDDAAFNRLVTLKARQAGDAWNRMANRLDRGVSAPDGVVWFSGLLPGSYQVDVALPRLGRRYGTLRLTATLSTTSTVAQEPEARLVPCVLAAALSPTVLTGQVLQNGQPVGLAEVSLDDGLETTLTQTSGQFTFLALEPGNARPLCIRQRGALLIALSVDIAQGQTNECNVSL